MVISCDLAMGADAVFRSCGAAAVSRLLQSVSATSINCVRHEVPSRTRPKPTLGSTPRDQIVDCSNGLHNENRRRMRELPEAQDTSHRQPTQVLVTLDDQISIVKSNHPTSAFIRGAENRRTRPRPGRPAA